MKNSTSLRKGILMGMACLLLWVLSACSCSQQNAPLPTGEVPVYATLAPAPTLVPSSTEGLEGWDPEGLVTIVTPGPMTTPNPATATPYITPQLTPQPTSSSLRNGDSGDRVRTVQQRLKDLGYLSGSTDGVFGNATEEAVRSFQQVNGLNADGVVGTRTLDALQSSSAKSKPKESTSSSANTASATSVPRPVSYTPSEPTTYGYLQLGSTGSAVKKLQNRLIELGYLDGTASGTFDEATEAAVIAFQLRNGEWDDGIAGQDTQSKLFSNDALAAKKN